MVDGPLNGVRVLELAEDLAAAFAGQIVADQGADVIKVERPQGDPLREYSPYAPGESKLFQSLGRGKKSVVVDVGDDAGRDVVRRLAARSDVVITSLPRSVLGWLGVDYDSVKQKNDAVVYVELSAFGTRGPWAGHAGNDLVMQAFTGLMASENKRLDDGAPAAIRSTQMPARTAGIVAALGVSTGLYYRKRTGKGQHIETSQLVTALAVQAGRTSSNPPADERTRTPGLVRLRKAREDQAGFDAIQQARTSVRAGVGNIFYRAYQSNDGAVFIGALSRPLRDRARRALETDFMARDDPSWDPTDPEAQKYAEEQVRLVEERFRRYSTEEWEARCDAQNVPVGEVVFPEDLADSEQARANHYIVEVEHETAGTQQHVAPVAKFNAFPLPKIEGAPSLGRDTEAVLKELE